MIVAAMSGGVDSATAAALLVEQGQRVVGMTMRLYDARGTAASVGRALLRPARHRGRARRVRAPRHPALRRRSRRRVRRRRRRRLRRGVPRRRDAEPVREVQPAHQVHAAARARARDRRRRARRPATTRRSLDGDGALRRGVDAGKDQSYFLFSMPGDELDAVRFPLGALDQGRGPRPRAPARPAERRQGRVAGDLLRARRRLRRASSSAQALRRGRALPAAGAIVDAATGAVVGRHDGTHRFTVGQHRGLGNLATTRQAST